MNIHVELRSKSQSFFKGSEFSRSEVSRSEFSRNPVTNYRFLGNSKTVLSRLSRSTILPNLTKFYICSNNQNTHILFLDCSTMHPSSRIVIPSKPRFRANRKQEVRNYAERLCVAVAVFVQTPRSSGSLGLL